MRKVFALPVALVLSAVPTVVHVQQAAGPAPGNEPVVVRTALAAVRVTSIKGFVYLTTDMRDGAVLKLEPAAAAATV